MKKIATQHRNDFWKHAKNYGKQIEVDELYNRWSIKNHFSKTLDVQIRDLIQNDIHNIRTALTFSGTPEELKEYMEKAQTSNVDPLSSDIDMTDPLAADPMLDTSSDMNSTDPLTSDIDDTPSPDLETESEQQVLPDMINS